MSYILDALRKSEQERLRGQALATLAHAAPVVDNTRRNAMIGALLAGNLLLLGSGAWWWIRATNAPSMSMDQSHTAARTAFESAPQSAVDALPGTTTAVAPSTIAAAIAAPPPIVINPRVPVRVATAVVRIAPESRPPPAPTSADQLIPGAIPANFPPLTLSTHIYSSDASFRTVVINGTRLHEGERLQNGVHVVEITEDGAHVEYQGQAALLKLAR